jgi:uncharacterized coiled-coil DUF342 family protein
MEQEIKDKARRMAIDAASADPELHKYTEAARTGGAREPHDWVVNAIAKALKERTPVQVGRAVTDVITEIVDKEIDGLRRRHEAAVDSISARLRALEGTGDRTSSPARTSVVDVLNLCRDALVRITALEGIASSGSAFGERLKRAEANATDAQRRADAIANTYNEEREDRRALSGRVQALVVRVDQLEAGRTGTGWIGDMGHAARRHLWPRAPNAKLLVNGKPRDVTDHGGGHYSLMLEPEDTNLGRVAVSDPTTESIEQHNNAMTMLGDAQRAIATMTKERDSCRSEFRALHDGVRMILSRHGHDAPILTGGIMTQIDKLLADRKMLEGQCAERAKERDEARRGYKCAVDERDALEKQRDEAVRQRDQYGDRNKAHSATTADQAAQIAELRATLKQREAEHSAALSRQASTWESDRREGAEQVRRLIEENQSLRSQSGTMWPKSERDKAMAEIAELQLERDNTWRLLDHRVDGQPFYSEQDRPIGDMVHEVLEHYRREIANLRDQLRVADADRVPLRMDLDIATAHLKERTAECDRMRPLVAAAQRMAGSYTATAWPEPFRSVARHVIEASEAYETACSQAADEDDDGFANAAANEGARIAAESRAEAENDPGT